MDFSRWLFWNVDTQVDFVEPHGKLYVEGAEKLKPVWKEIRRLANENNIQVVNTADFHWDGSQELSNNPDFVTTFPPHCMAHTHGADYVAETKPQNPLIIDWDKKIEIDKVDIIAARNIVIRKDAFDVFAGNPYTSSIVKTLSPDIVVVFGVTTNVCVNDAVVGLSGKVKNIIVIEDAIKELPNIPLPFENWKKLGIKMTSFKELKKLLEVE